MAIVMKASELAARVRDVAENYKTLYVMGCFGAPMTKANKKRYIEHHPYNQSASRQKMINAATDDTFGFDCVNLIKGILWGWNGDKSKMYGGAKYAVKGVPDTNANGMIKLCRDVTTDFGSVEIGEALWCSGHIGVYIGDGLGVECTPAWKNRVQITAVSNMGAKAGYSSRKWTKHGKLPYVEYDVKQNASAPSYTVGSDNEHTVYNFLTEILKLNRAAACGILANIYCESGFKPAALGDGGTSYGICQWHKTRYDSLKNWCTANGKDYKALDGQLWYLKYELENSYKSVLTYVKKVPDTAQGAYDAGYQWCVKFEIPADKEKTGVKRGNSAKMYYAKYSGGTLAVKPASKVEYAAKFDASLSGNYVVTAPKALHIRAGAGTNKASLGTLPKGAKVMNYGYYNLARDGTKWLYVKLSNGKLGYCSVRYLKKTV